MASSPADNYEPPAWLDDFKTRLYEAIDLELVALRMFGPEDRTQDNLAPSLIQAVLFTLSVPHVHCTATWSAGYETFWDSTYSLAKEVIQEARAVAEDTPPEAWGREAGW